jgi:predicted dinucleotide-binding enzyme
MRITIIGGGRVGSALGRRWTAAGHDVMTLGRAGGDAGGSEVILVAIPGDAIADGFSRVTGFGGQITIDATNKFGDRPPGFDSVAEQVKSFIGGPTAKAFNTNFAVLYDKVDAEAVRPGTLFAADPDARTTTERLILDAGFQPVHLGDLGQAPLLESLISLTRALDNGDMGPFFYRFTRPGELASGR